MIDALTDDSVLGARLRLLQPAAGHRAGTDAILLAAAVPAISGEHVMDFGSGVGTAGLAVLARIAGTRLTSIEIGAELAELARENAARNGFADRTRVKTMDVANVGKGAVFDAADHVLSNPPFNSGGRPPPDAATARARLAPAGLLDTWCRAAARVVKPGGSLTLIHRPDALAELLAGLDGRFGGVRLRFVHVDAGAPAVRILVQGRKGSRAPLAVAPPLLLDSEEAKAAHREAGAVAM